MKRGDGMENDWVWRGGKEIGMCWDYAKGKKRWHGIHASLLVRKPNAIRW